MACISPIVGNVLSIVINNGATRTNSYIVYLIMSAEATQMKVSNKFDLSDANWEVYVTSKQWSLDSNEGLATVYVKFKNAVLEESGIFSDTIILDAIAPQVSSPGITINNNEQYVTTANVTLYFHVVAEDGLRMCIVNDNYLSAVDDDWEDYVSFKSWTLSDVDGIKMVWVQFKDCAENMTQWYSAEVILNTETLQVPVITEPSDSSIVNCQAIDVDGMAERGSKIIVKVT